MKTRSFLFALCLGLNLLALACANAPANNATKTAATAASSAASSAAPAPSVNPLDYAAIAQKVVTQCAGVKAGDLVLVSGGPGQTELLENAVVEVAKIGAATEIHLSSPTATSVQSSGPETGIRSPFNSTSRCLLGITAGTHTLTRTGAPSNAVTLVIRLTTSTIANQKGDSLCVKQLQFITQA